MPSSSFYPRRYLVAIGAPALLWLTLFIGIGTYAIFALAFGTLDPFFYQPQPAWNPRDWTLANFQQALHGLNPIGGQLWEVFSRTIVYIVIAVAGCIVVGYPVAYYVAMRARRSKALLLILLLLPFLVSYMLRMLAWIGLLAPNGYVNGALRHLHLVNHPSGFLDGRASTVVLALIYGWVPYFILPLYAALERLDRSYIEAAYDLGANPVRTFIHVTLPLSKQGILAGVVLIALPMFGDYFTNQLVSGATGTIMFGNVITTYITSFQSAAVGAALAALLVVFLSVVLAFYIRSVARAMGGRV
jgi:spermidine/putrescine transport system permease protein